MLKRVFLFSVLVGFLLSANYLDTVTGEEADIDYDEKDKTKDQVLHYSGGKPDVAGKLAPGEGVEGGEDKQVVGNTVMTMIRRIREIMRRGMFSNSLLRGTMQCIQTWTGCTLDSAMGATGGASNSFTSSTPPNISTCIRQMSDCTRDAANNSPIGTLLQPLPPATTGR